MSVVPEAALNQHIAVLGKTGSGKSWAAKTFIEPLLAAGRRVGIVDPTSAWWGLRSSRDGKGPGFPILVLGGDHGDLPLPALGGAAVARLLVEQNVNLVADTSALTVGERTRWFIDFATTLHRLNRQPLHLVLDEAHMFAPQGKVPDPDTGKMLHAATTLASAGRSRGIRLTMITQRPQKLHKDALTSADTLIAMRVLAPQDRLAVEDWIKGCGDLAMGKEVLNSLASLKRGEGWVWYPEGHYLKLTVFPAIRTFDSSATPTDGHAAAQPKGAAEIDLSEVRTALADAVREAEANDPKLLRKRIAELERDEKPADSLAPGMIRDAELLGHQRGKIEGYRAAMQDVSGMLAPVQRLLSAIPAELRKIDEWIRKTPPAPTPEPAPVRFISHEVVKWHRANGSLPTGERAILIACAQHEPAGCTREQLTILTGYKRSTRNAYVQRLMEKGYVEVSGEQVHATQAGMRSIGPDFKPLPTGAALRDYWIGRLPEGERKVLQVTLSAYPADVSREAIGGETGYKRSTRNAYIQRLITRQLVSTRGDRICAREELFHALQPDDQV